MHATQNREHVHMFSLRSTNGMHVRTYVCMNIEVMMMVMVEDDDHLSHAHTLTHTFQF